MKRILITGADSFIGTAVEKYLAQWPGAYEVDTIDMHGENWRERSFSGYDAIFHVAGIAHSDVGGITDERKKEYYRVNTALTIEAARKARKDGVLQFIFMSSSIVYGPAPGVGKHRTIHKDTPVGPENCYGESKLKAEEGILKLDDGNGFKVVVLRPPIIYGRGCKGNYQLLSKLALRMPFFPYVKNRHSMLYVENLAEFVRLMIENEERGIFCPQNREYTNTSEMVRMIREVHGKKTYLVKGVTWALKILDVFSGKVRKAFGSWCYDKRLSEYKQEYRLVDLHESILRTEMERNREKTAIGGQK